MSTSRQKLRGVVLNAGMHALDGMTELLPRMKQRQATFDLIEDVEYTRHGVEPLCLDILRPKGAGPHPVLIYLHGGAFAIGSKRSHRALAG